MEYFPDSQSLQNETFRDELNVLNRRLQVVDYFKGRGTRRKEKEIEREIERENKTIIDLDYDTRQKIFDNYLYDVQRNPTGINALTRKDVQTSFDMQNLGRDLTQIRRGIEILQQDPTALENNFEITFVNQEMVQQLIEDERRMRERFDELILERDSLNRKIHKMILDARTVNRLLRKKDEPEFVQEIDEDFDES